MTDVATRPTTVKAGPRPDDYVAAAESLIPLIEAESSKIEEAGRLTERVVDALVASGIPWLLVPKDLGGGGGSYVEELGVLEAISYADASTGWSVAAYTVSPALAGIGLPADGLAKLYGGEEKTLISGFGIPTGGTARKVEGGYELTGARMPFGSGTLHTTRVNYPVRVVDDNGEPMFLENGEPDVRTAYPPTSTVTFHDNWNVSGLRGSGSGDYEVAAQFIEEDFIYTLDMSRRRKEPQYLWGYWGITYIFHIGFGLGVLKRAVAEVSKIVEGKARGPIPSLGDYDPFLTEYARHEAQYQAVRSYAYSLVAQVESDIEATGELSEINQARLGQLATWLHEVGGEIFDFAYHWAGSQPLRMPSALGRAFRDFKVAQNHLVVDRIWYPGFAKPIIKTWQG